MNIHIVSFLSVVLLEFLYILKWSSWMSNLYQIQVKLINSVTRAFCIGMCRSECLEELIMCIWRYLSCEPKLQMNFKGSKTHWSFIAWGFDGHSFCVDQNKVWSPLRFYCNCLLRACLEAEAFGIGWNLRDCDQCDIILLT